MPVRRHPIALLAAALLAPGAAAHGQAQDGTISTVAGGFSAPSDVAFVEGGGFVVADTGNDRIRRVDPSGAVTTDVDGLNGPQGVTAWPGGGYLIADTMSDRLVRVFPDGSTDVLDAGPLSRPSDTHVYPDGTVLIADTLNGRIRKLDPMGNVSTVAGSFDQPRDVAVDSNGAILVADTRNHQIVRLGLDGSRTVVAGTSAAGLGGDGDPARTARIDSPQSIVATTNGGFLFADTANDRVRRVTPLGAIFTVAGTTQGASGDGGPANQARLSDPGAITLDPAGGFLVADTGNGAVRRVTDLGRVPDARIDRSVRLALAGGSVGVLPAGGDRALPLLEEDLVPLRSAFDTRRGRIAVATQLPSGAQQVAVAFEGRFSLFQQAAGYTNFRLPELSCPRPSATPRASIAAKRKRRKKRRRLWVSESGGNWRSSTGTTSASAVGTMWLTELRCDGTLVSVTEGIVRVRDKRSGRRRLVRAGQSYLNRAR